MACCLLILFIFVLPAIEKAPVTDEPVLLVMLGEVTVLVLLAVPIIFNLISIRKQAANLDQVMQPFQFSASNSQVFGRQYHGLIHGRLVDNYITRGPKVDIRVSTTLQTRFRIAKKSTELIQSKQEIQNTIGKNQELSFSSADPAWLQQKINDSAAAELVSSLMNHGAGWAIFREIILQPGDITLFLYRSRNTFSSDLLTGEFETWLDHLQQLAEKLEQLPQPDVVFPVGQPSRTARMRSSKVTQIVVVALLVLFPITILAIAAILVFVLV